MKVGTKKKQTLKAKGGKSSRALPATVPRISIATTIHDLVRPLCEVCAKRALPHSHCDLCGRKAHLNHLKSLARNHKKYNVIEKDVKKASFVCSRCKRARTYLDCSLTEEPFYATENCAEKWNQSGKLTSLLPYLEIANKYNARRFETLSPEGLSLLEGAFEQCEENLRLFVGGTRYEYLKGFDVERVISRIEVGESLNCQNPPEVEDYLKRYCAQLGANGYIKFFHDKKIEHHQNSVIAGHGPKGKPYYRTERWTTACYVGYAEAVILRPRKSKPRN